MDKSLPKFCEKIRTTPYILRQKKLRLWGKKRRNVKTAPLKLLWSGQAHTDDRVAEIMKTLLSLSCYKLDYDSYGAKNGTLHTYPGCFLQHILSGFQHFQKYIVYTDHWLWRRKWSHMIFGTNLLLGFLTLVSVIGLRKIFTKTLIYWESTCLYTEMGIY